VGSETLRSRPCSIARALSVVGDRWTLLVLREAFQGASRFEEFRNRLGIARNILSARLRGLVDEGVLEMVAYQNRPVRHEYRLTDAGRDLYPVMLALMAWGDRWRAGGEPPPLTLIHRRCGHPVTPAVVCPDCGEPLSPENTRARLGAGSLALRSA
jgi:DNA-binding HxlR family transcriptional regulator